MYDHELIVFGAAIIFLIMAFFVILKISKEKQLEHQKALEDEIYTLKAKIIDQEKIIKYAKNSSQSRLALEQIKKIESLQSEIKRHKKRVQDAKAIAQEAHNVKSEFLSNIRHEIRSPMNSIIVFAELLVQESQNAKLQNYAKNIYSAGKKLLEMLDDIIELSRVEKGTFVLEEKPVDIKALIQNIVRTQREEASRKGLEFTLDIDEKIPDSLMLDESKIEDIFANLIENAVKFTNKGYVCVKLEEDGKDIAKNSINFLLTVEDSGSGIADEDKEKIFEIFESSKEKELRGIGLGLSINKRMAKLMNGDIFVESQVGKGSKFIFALTGVEVVLLSADSKEYNEDMIDFSLIKPSGGTVMVIDENAEVRSLIRDSFFESALKVLSYDNPRDAIEALKHNKVDMIFIDIDILTSDDNAVSKILKGISDAPVITLTEKQIRGIGLKFNAAKIAGHLKKPLSKSELFKISLHVLKEEDEHAYSLISEDEESFENLQRSQVERFSQLTSKNLNQLYDKALKTHDLDTIKLFAEELLSIALDCAIEDMVKFADKLLVKIELFEIDAINNMMQQYKQKVSRLKNSIV
ncbi:MULTISPECIES: ATP-binding protein [Sulfurimonas]|uniref:hybrid sensor histidine kinase/response regulator n=1 Tax=Sulfurimonas TaxID=202746 RepID=UPI0012645F1B|nr:ATP-binding protein [Sulfurimonas indica]